MFFSSICLIFAFILVICIVQSHWRRATFIFPCHQPMICTIVLKKNQPVIFDISYIQKIKHAVVAGTLCNKWDQKKQLLGLIVSVTCSVILVTVLNLQD